MHITTLPVYSKLADPAEAAAFFGRNLPVQLRQHQLATAQALADPDCDIVINTALTGDGKSLAGRLDTFVGPQTRKLLALYPTNDLIQDQHSQDVSAYIHNTWGFPANRVAQLSAAHLDELTEASHNVLTRPETLLQTLNTHRLILTNPDIFHGMVQFHYQQYGRDPAQIAGRLSELFERIVADEFHSYDAAQVTALLTGLMFLYAQKAPTQPLKTLLLSATPSSEVYTLLQRAGFAGRWRLVDPVASGWYAHGAAPDATWSLILRQAALHIVPAKAADWLTSGIDSVLIPWFQTHGAHARAAIIVNSVATAQRLKAQLDAQLTPLGLTVGSTTGLDDRPTRLNARDADVLIGTSTVDVGIDFKINLLIFEAPTAASFGQRLGRLGRHPGYTAADGTVHPFHTFAAYALVPPYVYERLTTPGAGAPSKLTEDTTLDRVTLSAIINDPTIYPSPPPFDRYVRHWGRFVPARVLESLRGKQTRGYQRDRQTAATFSDLYTTLWQPYAQLVNARMSDTRKAWEAYRQADEELLVREAQSFRGGSPLQCGVLRDGQHPVSYDLLWLLRYAVVEWMREAQFLSAANAPEVIKRPFTRGRHCGFGRIIALRDARSEPTLLLFDRAQPHVTLNAGRACVLAGLKVDAGEHHALHVLNDDLAARDVVATCVPNYAPDALRQEVYLPGLLPLASYQFVDAPGGGTIAFGRAALLLDSYCRGRKLTITATGAFFL